MVQDYLATARGRRNDGLVAVEGLWALRHALAHGLAVVAVFPCEARLRGDEGRAAIDEARARGAAVVSVGERTLGRMVERDGPDGIAALVQQPTWTLDDLSGERLVVADAIDLPGNLGTIIRCADGAGVAAVLVVDRRVRRTHPLVVKASMATSLTVPVVDVDRSVAVGWLRTRGFRTVAADPAARASYRDADYGPPVAIVVGNERRGLPATWRESADAVVSIPMLGAADSLNVTHAAALLMYEALHQQRARGS